MKAAHDPVIVALGHEVFVGTCSACHREDGGGNIGPNLTDAYWIHGGRPTEVLHTVTTGVVDKGMPAWGDMLPAAKVRAAAVYVLTLRGTHPLHPKPPQGVGAEEHEGEASGHGNATAHADDKPGVPRH
jgi:cytochrome c oxidase cbb3-type subunit 3